MKKTHSTQAALAALALATAGLAQADGGVPRLAADLQAELNFDLDVKICQIEFPPVCQTGQIRLLADGTVVSATSTIGTWAYDAESKSLTMDWPVGCGSGNPASFFAVVYPALRRISGSWICSDFSGSGSIRGTVTAISPAAVDTPAAARATQRLMPKR